MNVIIGNKQQALIENLGIDVIKNLNGEFTVEEIVETFKNFFYQRMILDITALKDYKDIKTLQKLSISLDMEKLILLLDNEEGSETGTSVFLSRIISMGIYNFTKNVEGIMYLYNTPNSYRDVAQYHQLEQTTTTITNEVYTSRNRIIGVKNLTEQAGTTTLIYMMIKNLAKNYDVIGLEIDKTDFKYFNDKRLVSVQSNKLGEFMLRNSSKEVILIDVGNDKQVLGMVTEMIYLVEPSIIKLSKMFYIKPTALKEAATHKIVLNKSMLSSKEIAELEYEAKIQFTHSIPALNDRVSYSKEVDAFLFNIGFNRQSSDGVEKKKKGFF